MEKGKQAQIFVEKKYKNILVHGFCYLLCLTGVFVLVWQAGSGKGRWEAAQEAVERAAADWVERPEIAITFDDGPHPKYTPVLLDGLNERGVKAAFFVIGENAQNHPEIVKREYDEGHIVGNHTYHHVDLNKISEEKAQEEIRTTNELLERITGEVPQFLRPPFGIRKKELEQKVDAFPVLWTIDPLDWNTENIDEIVNKVVTQAKDGDIILLHDCYESSVKAALRIVDDLQKKGFLFVRADQLITD